MEAKEVNENTLYDLASLTKVIATTTAVEQFFERGELHLKDQIIKFFPKFAQNGKENITVKNCLEHNSGFPPDPSPRYWEKIFGCPESKEKHPKLTFSCQEKIKEDWLKQKLDNPVGEEYVYSDLSMMTMSYIIGQLSKKHGYIKHNELLSDCNVDTETCYYAAYVQKYIFDSLELKKMRFLPTDAENCAPAWYDNSYRNEQIKGYVSDGNSYANGGVFGHAGVFSNLDDIEKILRDFMFENKIVSKEVVEKFILVQNKTQSSRALGWDTNLGFSSSCQPWSESTYLHTGYTGTQVCNDPENKIFTILLTNRCFPKDEMKEEIKKLRIKFNYEVKQVLKL